MNERIVRIIFDGNLTSSMKKINKFMCKQKRRNNLTGLWIILILAFMVNEAKLDDEQDKEIEDLRKEIDRLKGEQTMK